MVTLDHLTGSALSPIRALPRRICLADWIPGAVGDQGLYPLCTAAVVAGLGRYWANRTAGCSFEPSLLFNYRLSRRIAGKPDRNGSTVRHALAAWLSYGLVPEHRWPFTPDRVDVEPPAEVMVEGAALTAVTYGRLDGPEVTGETYLDQVRHAVARGLPTTIDFPLGASLLESLRSGVLTVPPDGEPVLGRHAVLVVGYDDDRGALRFRNNWGENWGDRGYGWMPYAFVRRGIARDSWVVLESPWQRPA
ncbi:C1 family peptidase [Actinoplanes oblitus]|uniref:C1 family peptidase n=1 Tax=Actinoplanes oblitus TaxID=3040509 RepID=A0ABY8WHR6_9ACTN|nr:C1 family peptidase [Actinoplanes oblitus]WIM96432.1 C1 family peptidase [Actinoplanes oblitus]